MKLRLMCLPEEVGPAVDRLRAAFDVVSVSDPDPMRGDNRQVRVYVEVRLPVEAG